MILTPILGYITLCIAVAAVIILSNFVMAMIALGFAIAAVVVAIFRMRTVGVANGR